MDERGQTTFTEVAPKRVTVLEVPDVANDPRTGAPSATPPEKVERESTTLDVDDVVAGPEARGIARQRESVRGILAVVLAGTFAAAVLGILTSVLVFGRAWEDIRDAVTYVIPALTGLLGAALGFYFGTTSTTWTHGAE